MPVLVLKALECTTTEDDTGADECRLEISVDGQNPNIMTKKVNTGERWILNKSFSFRNNVKLKLIDEDWPDPDDFLGEVAIVPTLKNRATGKFNLDGADYTIWYEVIDSGIQLVNAHQIKNISLKQMLSRMGRGVLSPQHHQEFMERDSIYRCNEVISLKDTFRFHAQQDRGKGNTDSVRTWINRHCNPEIFYKNETRC